MNAIRQHAFEFILGILSALVGLAVAFVKGSPEGYIIAAIGLQVAAALYKIKTEIHTKVGDKLEVYSLMEKIQDPILGGHARTAMENCKGSLKQLTEGKIRDRADLILHSIIEMISQARSEVLAVHVGRTVEHISKWQTSVHMRTYYTKNLEALSRGVKVQRIFILSEEHLCDPVGDGLNREDRLCKAVVEVLDQQWQDGIDVYCAWESDILQTDFSLDMIVVDEKWVEYGMGAGGFVGSEWMSNKYAFLSANKTDIEEHVKEFNLLKTYANEWKVRGKQKEVAVKQSPALR
jgi:hypothetical protein